MLTGTYSKTPAWPAPSAASPLRATVSIPGSKSLTNRELVLSALASSPSRLTAPLESRDTDLMVQALAALGVRFERDGDDLHVHPERLRGGATIDCGLAGTLMRFLPPLAALVDGDVRFDGDERARSRPMATTITSLRSLGVTVDDDGAATMPFTVHGTGRVRGGRVVIDASASSQFVSGLLLSAARFDDGIDLEHRGAHLPSIPHIDMTVHALRDRGVHVETESVGGGAPLWRVTQGHIHGRHVHIEPDLSNAAPFLAAALIAGGSVTIAGWPKSTTQVGDKLREWLPAFGADLHLSHKGLTIDGGAGVLGGRSYEGATLDLSEGGELAPTIVGLAALATTPSTITGIGHLRGHETDRLQALVTELTALGCVVEELADGLVIEPRPMTASGRPWHAYADHRIATTGALVGLAVPGLTIDDITTTAKTLPQFPQLWAEMLA
jgi:3-phosphoshikimate 1-carboxyvinyltransferase